MDKPRLPDLSFPDVKIGSKETAWTLAPLLYLGGTSIRINKFAEAIAKNTLGDPLPERIDLVRKLHQVIAEKLACGASKWTEQGSIKVISRFFQWIDQQSTPLDIRDIETVYREWADHLLHRARTVRDISENSACVQGALVGRYLDTALERLKPIFLTTRLRMLRGQIRVRSTKSEKQNLADTFSLGSALLDICDGLSLKKFWGPLPVTITLRSGQSLIEHSMAGKRKWPHDLISSDYNRRAEKKAQARIHAAHEADRTLATRYPLANLRIEAEMLTFIGQTGMNLAQAHQLRVDSYSYVSSTNGYLVKSYKHRRHGPVLFEIFGEYRQMFERYLGWRRAIFPNDPNGLLFPLIRRSRHITTPPSFDRIRTACLKLDLRFIAPQRLRKTRVNWLLRRSRDPDLTAEMDQHTKETLLAVYEEPSLQISMVEVTKFWRSHDPAIAPPSPGVCVGSAPAPTALLPAEVARPDCLSPAGCFSCMHHRDIDSFDYVWALCSYRYLKTEELAAFRRPRSTVTVILSHPAEYAIERVSAKILDIRHSSKVRGQWVNESLIRIEEGYHHPEWAGLISI